MTAQRLTDLSPEINQQLQEYRQEIDAIDAELVALLKQRIEVVSKVGMMKRNHTQLRSYIRSGREAQMIRHFYQQFLGSKFSPVAAASIWRHIIAASTHHESPLLLSVFTEDSASSRLLWLAREYFGSFIEHRGHQSSAAIMADLASDRANIAILPALQLTAGHRDPWWAHLLGPEGTAPRVFACLPFLVKEGEWPEALAAAYLIPERTGEDISLLALEEAEEISIPLIRDWFLSHEVQCFHSFKETHNGTRYILLEVDGYVPTGHPFYDELLLAMRDRIRHITWLGSYAKPLLITQQTRLP